MTDPVTAWLACGIIAVKVICPDCLKEFYANKETLLILADAYKTNPKLKFVCSTCGDKILQKYITA